MDRADPWQDRAGRACGHRLFRRPRRGSLFYIAYALEHGDFPAGERLWAMAALVVIGSIIIHGISATPVMAALDARRAHLSKRRGDSDVATTPA